MIELFMKAVQVQLWTMTRRISDHLNVNYWTLSSSTQIHWEAYGKVGSFSWVTSVGFELGTFQFWDWQAIPLSHTPQMLIKVLNRPLLGAWDLLKEIWSLDKKTVTWHFSGSISQICYKIIIKTKSFYETIINTETIWSSNNFGILCVRITIT